MGPPLLLIQKNCPNIRVHFCDYTKVMRAIQMFPLSLFFLVMVS